MNNSTKNKPKKGSTNTNQEFREMMAIVCQNWVRFERVSCFPVEIEYLIADFSNLCSNLLTSQEYFKIIEFLDVPSFQTVELRLLMHEKGDNWNAQLFHQKCNNQGILILYFF